MQPSASVRPSAEPTLDIAEPVLRPELLFATMTDSGAAVLLHFSQPVDIRTPVAEEFFNCTMLFSDAE
eukprot:scaffold3997_cov105-Pinguiococcus_pyrenoidosus.AAC.1